MQYSLKPHSIQLTAAIFVGLLNLILGAWAYEFFYLIVFWIAWGMFAGEFLIAVLYLSWGPNKLRGRIVKGAPIGIGWYTCWELGTTFGLWKMDLADRWQKVGNHISIDRCYAAMAILVILIVPFTALRLTTGVRFDLPSESPTARRFSLRQLFWLMSLFALAIVCLKAPSRVYVFPYFSGTMVPSAILASLALASCLLVMPALMRESPRPQLLLPAFVAVGGVSWGWNYFLGRPDVSIYAILLGLSANLVVIAGALVWRSAGYRLQTGL